MRNNPNQGAELEFKELFETYALQEKLRRFFNLKRQKIFKHFTLQPYHSNFTYENVSKYVAVLDGFLMQEGTLAKGFPIEDCIEQPEEADEQIGFDAFYEALTKWGTTQTILTYDDLIRAE